MSHLSLVRGDSQTLSLELSNLPDGGLTDADITFTVEGLLSKTIGDGITVDDAEAGLVSISIDPGDTELSPDVRTVYGYDVEVRFSDGAVNTPLIGVLVVNPDVTREVS